jgi:hypothetical protein
VTGRRRRRQVPVRSRTQRHSLRPISTRIQFPTNCPNHGSPSRCKPKDEKTRKANHRRCRFLRVLGMLAVEREVADRCEDEEADEHPAGAGEEGFAAAVVLNDVEAVEGYAEIYAVLWWVLVRRQMEEGADDEGRWGFEGMRRE